ncbi:MAG: hypothetical protein WKG07_36050 [Hymenobacter sp.]
MLLTKAGRARDARGGPVTEAEHGSRSASPVHLVSAVTGTGPGRRPRRARRTAPHRRAARHVRRG